FFWPTLYTYLLFFMYGAYYTLGLLFGKFNSLFEFQRLYFTDPQSFYLIGRLLNVFAGALTAVLFFFAAKKAYSRRVSALAALFLATNFMHIRESRYARPDIMAGIFMAPAFMYLLSLKKRKDYFLAGLFTGLAASVKYQYILVLFPALLAHFFPGGDPPGRSFKRNLLHPGPLLLLLGAFLSFFATSPLVVLNLKSTFQAVAGAAGQDVFMARYGFSSSFSFHLHYTFLQGIGLPLILAALFGVLQALAKPKKADIVFIGFGVLYYLAITLGGSIYMRYALPLLFPLLVFAAKFADTCITAADRPGVPKPVKAAFTALLVGALLYLPVKKNFRYNSLLSRTDTRVTAASWIEENIPSGSRIGFLTTWPPFCPMIRENKESLVIADREIMTGYRHKFLLNDPAYPGEPNYYLAQIYEKTPVMLWYRGVKSSVKTLKSDVKTEKLDYIVTMEHYPTAVPDISPELNELVHDSYTLYKEVLPFGGKTPPSPLFDEPNGFYPPCDRFEGVLKPGPAIRIWKTTGAHAG
ncbi:MAG: hypothetical protein COT18_06050, partial [Elusimicrobia bacterium CG08_land_8_20_14_0_20_59_10]